MPLDTKQQPPYYTPGNLSNTPGPLTKVFTKITTTETVDTTEVTAATYTLPANTLATNGDVITLTFWGNSYNSASGVGIKSTVFTNETTYAYTGDHDWHLEIQLIRATSSGIYISQQFSYEGNAVEQIVQESQGSINFATTNILSIKIQAAIAGNVRCTAGYINILKTL